jgi:cation transport ATPase
VNDVVIALELGKKTVSKIKQNLFWAFAYNTGLIPIAGGVLVPLLGVGIFGWLPMLAGIDMEMSSLTVVGNSVLLGRYKPKSLANKSDIKKSMDTNKNKAKKNEYLITR